MSNALNHPALLFTWLMPLVALQGVPHTGALRTIFLLIGMVHLIFLKRLNAFTPPLFFRRYEIIVFWLLAAWLAGQAAFIADEPAIALQAFASQWGKLMLMTLVGVALARLYPDRAALALSLFAGAFIHVLATWGAQILSLVQGHGLALGQSLLSEYPVASSFNAVAFIWLIVDAMSRFWYGRRILPWSLPATTLLLTMCMAAEAVLNAKSGQVMFLLLAGTAFLMLIKRGGMARRWAVGILSTGIIFSILLIATGNNRWTGMETSLHAAWQMPFSTQTLVSDAAPIPANTDHSFYMRAVRAKVAIEGIMQHPFGLGFYPDVFRRYVAERHGIHDAINNSNSGLLDFGLAAGIPGLCLLLLLTGLLMRYGWRAFLIGHPLGLALALLNLHQVGRYAIDGTLAGSRFTGYALIAATVWAMVTYRENRASS